MSQYDRPKLTHQIRQFDRNPGRGETILTAVASPSPKALQAENDSLARSNAVSDVPRNPRPEVYAHRDYYRDENDSRSIHKRPDLDEGVL